MVRIPRYRKEIPCGEVEARGIPRRQVEAKNGVELTGWRVGEGSHTCVSEYCAQAQRGEAQYLKGRSTRVPFASHHPDRRVGAGRDRTFWARGYFVGTVGFSEVTIRKCVRVREDASRIAR